MEISRSTMTGRSSARLWARSMPPLNDPLRKAVDYEGATDGWVITRVWTYLNGNTNALLRFTQVPEN